MSGCGHPDAARFVESVTAATGIRLPPSGWRKSPASRGDVYQFKITLRGVSKPPSGGGSPSLQA